MKKRIKPHTANVVNSDKNTLWKNRTFVVVDSDLGQSFDLPSLCTLQDSQLYLGTLAPR